MNLTIIGTSHIAKESVQEIKKAISEDKPEIVALELDLQRASALLQKNKRKIHLNEIFRIGIKGYLFATIGQYIQQKLGRMVGVAPGSEMKTGLLLAKKNKLEIALIDQPIQITLKNFSKNLTWREKFRFLGDILQGLFFPKKQIKEFSLEQIDLRKVPGNKLIKKMMEQLQRRYPSVYKTLVADRNKYMVNQLVKLKRKYPQKKILVIVGAGHEEGMKELLLKVEVVR